LLAVGDGSPRYGKPYNDCETGCYRMIEDDIDPSGSHSIDGACAHRRQPFPHRKILRQDQAANSRAAASTRGARCLPVTPHAQRNGSGERYHKARDTVRQPYAQRKQHSVSSGRAPSQQLSLDARTSGQCCNQSITESTGIASRTRHQLQYAHQTQTRNR
jgi:hypothetical protein